MLERKTALKTMTSESSVFNIRIESSMPKNMSKAHQIHVQQISKHAQVRIKSIHAWRKYRKTAVGAENRCDGYCFRSKRAWREERKTAVGAQDRVEDY